MVDDGSTDGSADVAAARAAADPRFTLLQVPNGGPGYARNRGVERASGNVPGVRGRATTPCRRMPTSACCTRWRIRARTSSPATCSGSARSASPSRRCTPRPSSPAKTGTHISKTPGAVLRRLGVEQAVPQVVLGYARPGLSRGHCLGGPAPDHPGPRAGQGGGRHHRPDLLLAGAGRGRAVDHPVPHRHQQLHRPDQRAAVHRRVPARRTSRASMVREHQRKALDQRRLAVRRRAGPDQPASSKPSS